LKRIVFLLIFVLIFLIPCSAVTASYDDKDNNTVNEITIDIPDGFHVVTREDLNSDSKDFADIPLSKMKIQQDFTNGVVLYAFADEKNCQITVSVKDDGFSKEIMNLSVLTDANINRVMDSIIDKTKENKTLTILENGYITETGGFKYINYTVREGDSETGYTYSSAVTIIGGKYIEITVFRSSPLLNDNLKDINNSIFSSAEIHIGTSADEVKNTFFQSFASVATIIGAVILIIFILYSFIKDIISSNKENKIGF